MAVHRVRGRREGACRRGYRRSVRAKKSKRTNCRGRAGEAPAERCAAGYRGSQLYKAASQSPAWEQELSAGASAMNIVTAATALGYGACWLTGWFAFDRDVLEGLGLKADEKLAGFIHIGTASNSTEDRPRPALSEIVTRF